MILDESHWRYKFRRSSRRRVTCRGVPRAAITSQRRRQSRRRHRRPPPSAPPPAGSFPGFSLGSRRPGERREPRHLPRARSRRARGSVAIRPSPAPARQLEERRVGHGRRPRSIRRFRPKRRELGPDALHDVALPPRLRVQRLHLPRQLRVFRDDNLQLLPCVRQRLRDAGEFLSWPPGRADLIPSPASPSLSCLKSKRWRPPQPLLRLDPPSEPRPSLRELDVLQPRLGERRLLRARAEAVAPPPPT